MASTIWKGTVSFGLVNIPVGLYTAVREQGISFRMLGAKNQCRIKYRRVCEGSEKEVPYSEIVKGYEYDKGKYLVMTPEDFEKAQAALRTSKTFEIEGFVPEGEIDPRFFEKPYFLVPTPEGSRAYALLREAMREAGTVAVGSVTMRQKHYLAAIKVLDQALILEILRFPNELADMQEFHFPGDEGLRPQEVKMARQLVESLAMEWDPSRYKDEYQTNLQRIINAKLKGKKVDLEEAEEVEPTGVIDLMERLQASLEKGGKAKKSPKKTATKKRKSA